MRWSLLALWLLTSQASAELRVLRLEPERTRPPDGVIAPLGGNAFLVHGDEGVGEAVHFESKIGGKQHDSERHPRLIVRALNTAVLPIQVVRVTKNLGVVPRGDDALAERLAKDPNVLWVEREAEVKSLNAGAMRALAGPSSLPLVSDFGSGEVVTVMDTGLDWAHSCFGPPGAETPPLLKIGQTPINPLPTSRHPKVLAYLSVVPEWTTETNDWEDAPRGHGTHVMCSAAGSQSDASVAAKLLAVDIGRAGAEHLLPPADMRPTMETSYDAGSRILSLSWGSDDGGEYTHRAWQLDEFVHERDDYVVLVAAGNSGPGLVGSPATCKNCVAVGASMNTYTSWFAGEGFEAGPSDSDHVGANPDVYEDRNLAAFSSRGPTKDGRRKPDVVAPGCMVLSARALGGRGGRPSSALTAMQGTSMATPIMARGILYVRDALRRGGHKRPSSALVRASLLSSALEVDRVVDARLFPDGRLRARVRDEVVTEWDQGWGRASLAALWRGELGSLDRVKLRSHEQAVFCLRATRDVWEASVAVAWTDPPGWLGAERQLVNDLDLTLVRNGGDGRKGRDSVHLGNEGSTPDRVNNAERVRLQLRRGDSVRVVVSAGALFNDAQDFSIVWSGAFERAPACAACSPWDPPRLCELPMGAGVRRCGPMGEWGPCSPTRCIAGARMEADGCTKDLAALQGSECPEGTAAQDVGLGAVRCGCVSNLPCPGGGFSVCNEPVAGIAGAYSECPPVPLSVVARTVDAGADTTLTLTPLEYFLSSAGGAAIFVSLVWGFSAAVSRCPRSCRRPQQRKAPPAEPKVARPVVVFVDDPSRPGFGQRRFSRYF